MPIASYFVPSKLRDSIINAIAEAGTLEVWFFNSYFNTTYQKIHFYTENFIYIYDSAFELRNFQQPITLENTSIIHVASQNSALTAFVDFKYSYQIIGFFQLVFRIPEIHSAHCASSKNLQFAFPRHEKFYYNMSAFDTGNCLFSIIPAASTSLSVNISYHGEGILGKFMYAYRAIYILNILSLKYVGGGNVGVVVYGYNEAYELFSFSSTTASNWNNTIAYGELISFKIPPNGQLFIECESIEGVNKTNQVGLLS
jgi:hypothetical protein